MDLTSAEANVTYNEPRDWVQEHYNMHVTNFNIAQVKQKHGIIERENYNEPKTPDSTTSIRMKQLFEEKTTPRNRDEDETMGYRDVLNTIHESNEYIPVRPSDILQLHRDLFKRAGFSYSGHFKNVQNDINETEPDGTGVTRFTPTPPYDTPEAVENLCNAYEQAIANEKIDSLILTPTFICDFLCIHPFNDGNGRMSGLLTWWKRQNEIGRMDDTARVQ